LTRIRKQGKVLLMSNEAILNRIDAEIPCNIDGCDHFEWNPFSGTCLNHTDEEI
jgi:hypothetical protein